MSWEKARKPLKVVSHGCCSTEQLRCFGNGRIYVRPVQRSIPLTESVRMQEETEHGLSCGETVSVSKMCDQLWACEVHIFRSTLYLGPFYLHKFNLFTLFVVHITLEEIFMMYIRYKYIKKFWIMILKMCTVTKVAQAFEKWWKWALPRPVTWWKWALPRPVTWHPDFWGV